MFNVTRYRNFVYLIGIYIVSLRETDHQNYILSCSGLCFMILKMFSVYVQTLNLLELTTFIVVVAVTFI